MIKPPMLRSSHIVCLLVFFSSLAYSQTGAPAAVTFTIDFPASQPEHYSIRVLSDGSAHYQSSGHLSADSDETDSFDLDFTVGAERRQKIFDLVAKADYFRKDIDSRHKGVAFTGKKTLSYKDAQRSGESTYNYSPCARSDRTDAEPLSHARIRTSSPVRSPLPETRNGRGAQTHAGDGKQQ